jgi:tetratricopeptide (TPR) repeat protein
VRSRHGIFKLKRFDEALASLDRAIARSPDYAEAHCNRGVVLYDLARRIVPRRISAPRHALALDCAPGSPERRGWAGWRDRTRARGIAGINFGPRRGGVSPQWAHRGDPTLDPRQTSLRAA